MLNRLHQLSALLLTLFIGMHLFNHLQIVIGVEQHLAVMDSLRTIYRSLVFEVLLLSGLLVQVCTGVFFIFRSVGRKKNFVQRLQGIAGVYLGFFMLTHVWDVLNSRMQYSLDTNFYLIAAKMDKVPDVYFLSLYYGAAIVAVTTHLGAAVHWVTEDWLSKLSRDRIAILFILLGVAIAVPILSGFSGAYHPLDIPENYRRAVAS